MSSDDLLGMDDDEFFRLLRKFSMRCAACGHGGQPVTESKFDGHSIYYCTNLNYCLAMRRRNERRRSQSVYQVSLERDGGYFDALRVRCHLTSDGDIEIYSATTGGESVDLDRMSDEEWFRLEQAIFKKAQEIREADQG